MLSSYYYKVYFAMLAFALPQINFVATVCKGSKFMLKWLDNELGVGEEKLKDVDPKMNANEIRSWDGDGKTTP